MKKALGILLVLMMIVLSMTTMAFATTESTVYPNFYGDAWLDNYNCVHKADAEVSLIITKEGMEDIIVPLYYDEYMESYCIETVVEGIDQIISEVGPEYDAMSEAYYGDEDVEYVPPLTLMKNHGYNLEVMIEDNDDEHEFLLEDTEISVEFLTKASVELSTNMLITSIEELIMEYDPNYEPVGSFDAFLELYKEMLMNPEGMDMSEEEAEEELVAIQELEAMLAALESGEYAGEMMVSAYVYCDCPEYVEYTIYHEYYDENGDYVAQDMIWENVPDGEVVSVEDLAYFNDYEGVEYEVEGVYAFDTVTGEVNWENPVEEFTVVDYYDEEGNWHGTQLIVKYIPVNAGEGDESNNEGIIEDGDGTLDEGDENTTDEGTTTPEVEMDPITKPAPEIEPAPVPEPAPAPETNVPLTGDETNLGLYIGLMLAAAYVMKKVNA